MYTANGKARTMNGHRISNDESMVNEEVLRRMSAPIALRKKNKRVGSLKDRSMSSIRKCIRAANKPYSFSKPHSLSKPYSISKASSSLSTATMPQASTSSFSKSRDHITSTVRLNANVNRTEFRVQQWPYAHVAYINGLKMVIRRSKRPSNESFISSHSSSSGKMLK